MLCSDVDILDIDTKIQENFQKEYNKLSSYQQRLEELKKTLDNGTIANRMKLEISNNIKKLESDIETISSNKNLNFYISETGELIQKYKEIIKLPIKISFLGKKKFEDKNRQDIISKFLHIAQKYYKIDIPSSDKPLKFTCNNCDNKKDFIKEENAYICTVCSSQQENIEYTISYKDSDRVNITNKYTYDRRVHFKDCINQYQGKQNCTIESHIYEDIERELEKHHLLQGDLSTKKEVRFSKITKEHILMFLKELGYSKHYENVTLIHYNLTGKKPDDISYLEDKLINDFDLLVETYDNYFKNKVERVNFISTQYVLYQLLQKHKHQCRKEDFVILKTMDRKTFHDSICQQLFHILNWNFIPIY